METSEEHSVLLEVAEELCKTSSSLGAPLLPFDTPLLPSSLARCCTNTHGEQGEHRGRTGGPRGPRQPLRYSPTPPPRSLYDCSGVDQSEGDVQSTLQRRRARRLKRRAVIFFTSERKHIVLQLDKHVLYYIVE
ncbi:hypothetical protein F7725_027214 [Dissostichus mawsoni]|uniref:Uncharacterized protein n=1 Tax=Dissostichus mawsoni TaxID=36200 RepID=A0A7J5XCA0_DISMA|nr:hypothetical protein F7725_027214 [Dissostichus mawsoni]